MVFIGTPFRGTKGVSKVQACSGLGTQGGSLKGLGVGELCAVVGGNRFEEAAEPPVAYLSLSL